MPAPLISRRKQFPPRFTFYIDVYYFLEGIVG